MSDASSSSSRFGLKLWLICGLGACALLVLGLGLSQPWGQRPLRDVIAKGLIGGSGSSKSDRLIELALVADDFEQPTDIQFVPGNPRLAIVLSKNGKARLWRLDADKLANGGMEIFDIAVKTDSELGLLGLAFHPDYANNGLFYLDYNPKEGKLRTRIAEWKASPPADPKTATEQRVLLEIAQPYSNHNGGQLAFGPEGFLYIGMGDGGSANDPQGNGQNLKSLLGKILRIDPKATGDKPYTVPTDNPFVGKAEARPEIWAFGLRNPWRFTFQGERDLIVADVGQNQFEEIDVVRRGDNMGWNTREAGHCFRPTTGCSTEKLIDPIFEYDHNQGVSVTGGFVYRGTTVPRLRDKYVFGDFGSGRLWAISIPTERSGAYAVAENLGQWEMQFSTFGRHPNGEIYAADFFRGKIYQLVAR